MTPEQTELAKRLAAHPRWRWLSGMLALAPSHGALRLCAELLEFVWYGVQAGQAPPNHAWCIQGDAYPDLTDPATVGCLAALVREVYGDPDLYCRPAYSGGGRWTVEVPSEVWIGRYEGVPIGDSEGEAWAHALLRWEP